VHLALNVFLIAFVLVAAVVITRARFGHKFGGKRRDDDGGEFAGVTAPLSRPPLGRTGSAKLEEPHDD